MRQGSQTLPQDQLGRDFCHYFSCGKYFIYQTQEGKWLTETRFIAEPVVLWRRYKSSQVIGIRFDGETNFFVIDLDFNSQYHYRYDPLAFYQLTECLEQIGIHATHKLQSSDSKGIHIIGFLPKKVNSYGLACALKMLLSNNGFDLAPGQLEIFPNPKPYNPAGNKSCGFNGIRLPLQSGTGSKLYNQKMRLVNGGIKKLLRLANKSSQEQNMSLVKRSISRGIKWQKSQRQQSYQQSRRENYRQDLEAKALPSWSDYGQTNEVLKSIANYGWVIENSRTPEELQEYIIQTAIALPGYEQYCRHQQDIALRAKHWSRSSCRYWAKRWAYPEGRSQTYNEFFRDVEEQINADPERKLTRHQHHLYHEANQRRQADSMTRLISCLDEIGRSNLPSTVGKCIELLDNTSKKLFGKGFSPKTLKKPQYRQIWQQAVNRVKTRSHNFHFKLIFCQAIAEAWINKLENLIDRIRQQVASVLPVQANQNHNSIGKSPLLAVVQPEKNAKTKSSNLSPQGLCNLDPTMKFLSFGNCVCLACWSLRLDFYINSLKKCFSEQIKVYSITEEKDYWSSAEEIIAVKSKKLALEFEFAKCVKKQEIQKRYFYLLQNFSNNYIYTGPATSLISTSKEHSITRLKPGTIVTLADEIHSTQLRHNSEIILMYVHSESAEKAIPVPINYLESS